MTGSGKKRGRPLIGETALSSTERVRRMNERRRQFWSKAMLEWRLIRQRYESKLQALKQTYPDESVQQLEQIVLSEFSKEIYDLLAECMEMAPKPEHTFSFEMENKK